MFIDFFLLEYLFLHLIIHVSLEVHCVIRYTGYCWKIIYVIAGVLHDLKK